MLLEVEVKQEVVLVVEDCLFGLVLEVFWGFVAVDLGQLLLFQPVCHFLFG